MNKESFFDFISDESSLSVVSFYGKNCPACTASDPVFDELSRMYSLESRVKFASFDCDRFEDVCESIGAVDRPAWLAWLPGQSHNKRYNRDFVADQFLRWVRQQTGLINTANEGNLLYVNRSTFETMKKRPSCLFAVIDQPMQKESQELHRVARELENKVKRGAKFVALSKEIAGDLAEKLLKEKNFGGFLFNKGGVTAYDGKYDAESLLKFLNDKKCGVRILTPTPTPTPMEELEDIEDDDYAENAGL